MQRTPPSSWGSRVLLCPQAWSLPPPLPRLASQRGVPAPTPACLDNPIPTDPPLDPYQQGCCSPLCFLTSFLSLQGRGPEQPEAQGPCSGARACRHPSARARRKMAADRTPGGWPGCSSPAQVRRAWGGWGCRSRGPVVCSARPGCPHLMDTLLCPASRPVQHPSRTGCDTCHQAAVGFMLAQLC